MATCKHGWLNALRPSLLLRYRVPGRPRLPLKRGRIVFSERLGAPSKQGQIYSYKPHNNQHFSSVSTSLAKEKMATNPSPRSFKIILGSSSIARRKILAEMGYEFEVMAADINEKAIRREKPDELVMVLAEAKADAIISRLKIADYKEKDADLTLLITSDIVVVHEGIIREKPASKEEARQFLKGYSGGHVTTVGSVIVTNLRTGRRHGGLDKVEVYFRDIPDNAIENMIDEGVVFNVAGGLLLEHPLTLPFVEAVIGASDSVMGLPKVLTEKLIHEALLMQS